MVRSWAVMISMSVEEEGEEAIDDDDQGDGQDDRLRRGPADFLGAPAHGQTLEPGPDHDGPAEDDGLDQAPAEIGPVDEGGHLPDEGRGHHAVADAGHDDAAEDAAD